MNKILLVEDQREFQLMVRQIFEDGQHSIAIAGDVSQAKDLLQKESFDIILMDISLPGPSGLDFYAELKNTPHWADIPVIFLTGSESLPSKITAFSLGAEDYVTKPFNNQELRVRVLSKIRKKQAQTKSVEEVQMGPFLFKLGSQRVLNANDGSEISLTTKEFKILYFLAKNKDVIFSREDILNAVWGQKINVNDRTVDSNIYLLRKKLGTLGSCVEAVSGMGYRFSSEAQKKKVA